MRVLIIQFSGTGNTLRIAQIMCQEFKKQDVDCQIIPMESVVRDLECPDFRAWDLIGIGFPVHAMDAPQILYDFLELLPKTHTRYFLFKTAGSKLLYAGSTYKIRLKLAFLRWKLVHEQLYEMPPNAFGSADSAKLEKRCYKARELAIQSVAEMMCGIKNRLPEPLFRSLCYRFAACEKQGASQASKRWTVSTACSLCRLCAEQCPTKNIGIQEGKLIFGDKCLLCLRCWWNCPTRAISHSFLKPFFLKEPYILPRMETDNEDE